MERKTNETYLQKAFGEYLEFDLNVKHLIPIYISIIYKNPKSLIDY